MVVAQCLTPQWDYASNVQSLTLFVGSAGATITGRNGKCNRLRTLPMWVWSVVCLHSGSWEDGPCSRVARHAHSLGWEMQGPW